ncbi:MAG: HAD family hydrolase [Elusimicrobiota bacterium]|jgi:histidinol-phosphate phosphatase family protein|nr:HAD family hydrolase [Elusimicrobiota bacterium]
MANKNIKYPCVFLDRDGTIIHDRNYLSSPEQVKLYSFSAKAVQKMQKAGFKVIIITNQSGISRGKFSEKELSLIHKRFISLLKEQGTKIDGLYYCPHIDSDNCLCRKPKIGMFLQAAKEHNIDLKNSYMIGDSVRDYISGVKMGGKGIFVLSGHGKKQKEFIKGQKIKPHAILNNIMQAANMIVKSQKSNSIQNREAPKCF